MDDYSIRGPCCDEYAKLRGEYLLLAGIATHLLENNPRYILMLSEAMCRNMGETNFRAVVEVGGGEKCPCNEAPYPELWRRFYPELRRWSSMGEAEADGLNERIAGALEQMAK